MSSESLFGETITLIPPGKLRCIVTDKLRNDTPEENVRQRISRSLMEDYGYDKKDIEIEFTVNLGRSKKRADIAIFLQTPTTSKRTLKS